MLRQCDCIDGRDSVLCVRAMAASRHTLADLSMHSCLCPYTFLLCQSKYCQKHVTVSISHHVQCIWYRHVIAHIPTHAGNMRNFGGGGGGGGGGFQGGNQGGFGGNNQGGFGGDQVRIHLYI